MDVHPRLVLFLPESLSAQGAVDAQLRQVPQFAHLHAVEQVHADPDVDVPYLLHFLAVLLVESGVAVVRAEREHDDVIRPVDDG